MIISLMSSNSGSVLERTAADGLPVALTPLLGRAGELEESQRLLDRTRLLTITGAGGSGKTRLALELAHRVSERFPDGAIWVDLSPVTEASLVGQEILNALSLREVPSLDVVEEVTEHLRDMEMLVVLDNCEHLIAESAHLAESILRSCPSITMIATTREALGIVGEQAWLVPPLAQDDAVQLFVERARGVVPSFNHGAPEEKSIRRICERLDGIPLAIELAAARVKVLSVDQIASRLDDAFRLLSQGSRTLARHRTIRETIDWSFRLLDAEEQKLLRRLSLFSGSFSLAAAESICGEDVDVLHLLSALVDKSLVISISGAQARYRLLETVRQFAAEKLRESGERERIRQKHALFFAEMIERAEPRIYAGSVDLPTMQMLDDEIGNVRAVFDWAEEDASRAEVELRLLWALHWYWFARGHFHEARERVDTAVRRLSDDIDPIVRARAIVAAGNAAMWQADWNALRPMIDEAVDVLRHSTSLRALANALQIQGTAMAFGEGDLKGSRKVFDEAKEVSRRNGRNVAYALTLFWDGLAAQLRGDLTAARASFEEGRQIGLDLDNKPALGHSSTALGHLSLSEKKYDRAMASFREALEVHAEVDDRWGLTQVIEGIGMVLLETGEKETAARLLAASSAAWLQMGARPGRRDDVERERDARVRSLFTDDRFRVAFASGAAMTHEDVISLARQKVADAPAVAAARASASSEPPLRVRALGPLAILRGDEPLDGGSQTARSRELLLYLLAHPSGATKEQIGAALWPDIEPARLRNNFHVTLHRLRKTLGRPEWIVADGETYAINRNAGIEFDAEAFERSAKEALRTEDPARIARAIEMYHGDFFENATSSEWHFEIRARLRDLYASALGTLGRSRMAAGDFAGAAEVYQRLFTFDPVDEQACRNLMRCLAQQGDTAAASRAYRRLTESLRRELDAEPDPATTKLHARVMAGSAE
jgi:predicted ATPase/DNA-binding SARP family transcriptional activator